MGVSRSGAAVTPLYTWADTRANLAAADLRRHAPHLVPRIARAQRDERRHARIARTLVRSLGASPPRTPRVPRVTRTLRQAAAHNAVEGCVHETFGAAVVALQAGRATCAPLRRFFSSIAEDEMEHAVLSWDVHDALCARLPPRASARIAAAQRRAIDRIGARPGLPEPLRATLGAPTVEERRALLNALCASLPGVA